MNPAAQLAPYWHLARARIYRAGLSARIPSVQLPFNATPVVATYLHTGFFFGMLSREIPCDGLLNTYIQLSAPRRRTDRVNILPLRFLPTIPPVELGLLEQREWPRDELARLTKSGLAAAMAGGLAAGMYLYANLNYFYLPETDFYRRRHFRQSALVIGFDSAAGEFRVACYLRKGNFGVTRVAAALLADAFHSPLGRIHCAEASKTDRLCGMKPSPTAFSAPLDLDAIKWQLRDYVQGTNAAPWKMGNQLIRRWSDRFDSSTAADTYYGVDIYEGLAELMQASDFHALKKVDFRITRLLWEHKKLMTIRLRRLLALGIGADPALTERWQEVEHMAWTLHFTGYRAVVKGDKVDPAAVARTLREMAARERDLLGALAEAIP